MKLLWYRQIWLWLLVATLILVIVPLIDWESILTNKVPISGTDIFLVLVIYAMAIWIWSMWTGQDRAIIRIEKKRLAKIEGPIKAFNELTGRQIKLIGLKDAYDFGITSYSEDAKILSSRDFEKYKMIGLSYDPKVYLVKITCKAEDWDPNDPNKTKTETIHDLGYKLGETKYWKLRNECLIDLNGSVVPVDLHEPDQIIKFIQNYKNVKEAALDYFRIICAPVLKNTKIEGHGHSEKLREIRELMENPEIMFMKVGVDYKSLLKD